MTHPAEKQQELLHTPLHALHVSLGARMVPFAGYDMPVQYADGVLKEHLHTRKSAGLFDVSHMGQCLLVGEDPAAALEKIVPSDIRGLKAGEMRYTVLLNDKGGIVDDLMVTRRDDKTLFVVVNAACKDKDYAYINAKIGHLAKLTPYHDRALLALQGPKAESVVAALFPKAAELMFMQGMIEGDYFINRCGYTGEDGFEISLPSSSAAAFAEKLLAHADVKPVGLGARDSLRLEAGLCLYGHDINDDTTPVAANLKWVVPKARRTAADFVAAEKIIGEFKNGTQNLRVGIKPEGKAPLREGTELFLTDGVKIGIVTSGGFGPTVDGPVAMGYVAAAYATPGTKINALLRGTPRPVEVTPLPFITPQYKKG